MRDFSIQAPVTSTNFEANWHMHGSALPHNDDQSLYASVGVSGRVSYMLSKKQMPTNDFEAAFSLSFATKDSSVEPHKQGLAFWYVQDQDVSNDALIKLLQDPEHLKTGSFSYELTRLGYDLFGYKSRYDGVCVAFTTRTVDWVDSVPQPRFQPSVVAAVNDGTKSLYTNSDVPTGLATKLDFLRNTANPMQVKLRVQPTAIKVQVLNPQTGSWQVVLDQTQGVNIKKLGVLGFTSFVEKHYDPYKEYDTIRIHDLTVTNFDRSVQILDEAPTVPPAVVKDKQ